jgi:hypothetical protein
MVMVQVRASFVKKEQQMYGNIIAIQMYLDC